MSEMKIYKRSDILQGHWFTEYCRKDEADRVIAELKERIADGDKDFEMADHQNERLLKLVRHHKYKRCLAMARWCESEAYIHEYGSEYDENLVAWFGKWYERWLEIAEQFKDKEAK